MKVYIEREDRWEELSFSGTAEELCYQLNINPQTVLVLKDEQLIPEQQDISDAKIIKLITVVSGG